MPRIISIRLRGWRRIALLALALPVCSAADAPATSAWNITNSTAALTGAASTVAVLQSNPPLVNMIGVAEPATLVLRCSDRVVAAFVGWPEVLSASLPNMLVGAQAIVLWRLDQRRIAANSWDVSTSGTAAGKFTTGGALKLIAQLRSARQLVVRMTGRSTQDATFDLAGIDDAAAQVERTCGIGAGRPT